MHEQLGKAYWGLDQLQNAQTEFESAVELDPDKASLHYVLGRIYQKEGLVEKARVEFDRVTVLHGTRPTPEAVRP